MALRVTRQNNEILAAGDGKIRVTRQYVEILASVDERTIEEAITFIETDIISKINTSIIIESLTITELLETDHKLLTDSLTFNESAEVIFSPVDILTFTEDAHLGTIYRIIEESITLDEDIVLWHNNIQVNESIIFAEEVIGHIAITYETGSNDSVTFTDSADYIIIPFIHLVSDTLTFLEDADTDEKGRTLGEVLTLSETIIVTHSVKTQELIDSFPFYEEINISGVRSFTVTDNLTDDVAKFDDDGEFYWDHLGLCEILKYDHVLPRPFYEKIYFEESISKVHVKRTALQAWLTDTLTLVETLDKTSSSAEDTLVFIETASYQKDFPQLDELEFSEEIILGIIGNNFLSDNLTINEGLLYELPRTNTYCTYSPFVGSTTDSSAPLAPSVIVPVIIKHKNIELSYEGTTITLRGPEFGNRNKLNYHRINRESRGGTLTVFADPRWPKQQTMLLDFYGLYEAESQSVLDFIILTLGKQFRLRDWEGNIWSSVIISPDNAIIRNHKNNNSISLEIIVQKAHEYTVLDTLVFYEDIIWLNVYDTLFFVEDADYPTLDWKTFTGPEWDTFSSFEWDRFVGE